MVELQLVCSYYRDGDVGQSRIEYLLDIIERTQRPQRQWSQGNGEDLSRWWCQLDSERVVLRYEWTVLLFLPNCRKYTILVNGFVRIVFIRDWETVSCCGCVTSSICSSWTFSKVSPIPDGCWEVVVDIIILEQNEEIMFGWFSLLWLCVLNCDYVVSLWWLNIHYLIYY